MCKKVTRGVIPSVILTLFFVPLSFRLVKLFLQPS